MADSTPTGLRRAIRLYPEDNVATAIFSLAADELVDLEGEQVRLLGPIAFGHKFALSDLAPGQDVIKYGTPIGRVTAPVRRGEHVHVHNVADIVAEVRRQNRL